MTDRPEDGALEEWLAFSPESELDEAPGSWRHPIVLGAVLIGIGVLIGLVVLRPTGTSRERAERELSALGLPTDFFEAEVEQVVVEPCEFALEESCSTVSFRMLEGPDEGRMYVQLFAAGGTTPDFAMGQVVILSYRAPNGRVDAWSEGPCEVDPSQTCTLVDVVMTRGDLLGARFTVEVAGGQGGYSRGDPVEVTFDESGNVISAVTADISAQYQFSDFKRNTVLLVVFLVFAAAVIALGRWRGVAALAGLGATLVIVVLWLLPAILDGRSPGWVALIGASAVAYVALYLSHGFSLMTTVALIGTLCALALTTALSALTVAAAGFTGFVSEESTLLTLFSGIDVRGLVLAGMVLGAAGALDDVTVTQASAVWQLKRSDPEAGVRSLWSGGLRIGQHHIGSTVNTLLLAYLGAALPLAILFVLAQQSLGTVVNSEVVAVEVVRTLVGSIGLVAAVPVTTWLAATIAAKRDLTPAAASHER